MEIPIIDYEGIGFAHRLFRIISLILGLFIIIIINIYYDFIFSLICLGSYLTGVCILDNSNGNKNRMKGGGDYGSTKK